MTDLSRLAWRAAALIAAIQRTTFDVATELHLSRDESAQTVVLPREGLETVIQLSRGERSGQNVCIPVVFNDSEPERSAEGRRASKRSSDMFGP